MGGFFVLILKIFALKTPNFSEILYSESKLFEIIKRKNLPLKGRIFSNSELKLILIYLHSNLHFLYIWCN
ncbi:hypothetical protein OA84_02690 [Kaistella solincola]|uniref:Uncharacterized protein n=1 Tax=Kaistella solincola TaxID=510955 RepID=A0ABR4ZT58_9FLAO|nr:hypothetical protein OA84_02690 [Kaistella solincola]